MKSLFKNVLNLFYFISSESHRVMGQPEAVYIRVNILNIFKHVQQIKNAIIELISHIGEVVIIERVFAQQNI